MATESEPHSVEWPDRNGMPNLGDCSPNLFLQFAVAATFEDQLSRDQHWFSANLARLTDKAIREYNGASTCLGAFIAGRAAAAARSSWESATVPIPMLSQLLEAADHFENCVDALRRMHLFLRTDFFVGIIQATGHDYPEFLDDLHETIRKLRNAIQHADEKLARGDVSENQPVFVAVGSDAITFAGESVLYAEMAAVIVTVRQFVFAAIGGEAS
jgi:hypothetical protein